MDIKRQQEVVEAFHYDKRNKEQELQNGQELQTEIKVGFSPLKATDENYPKENSIVGARLEFRLVFEEYLITGRVSQINHVINRQIEDQKDIQQEDVDELVRPLFSIIERLAYEVTEIALDQPGIQLNFQQNQNTAE